MTYLLNLPGICNYFIGIATQHWYKILMHLSVLVRRQKTINGIRNISYETVISILFTFHLSTKGNGYHMQEDRLTLKEQYLTLEENSVCL